MFKLVIAIALPLLVGFLGSLMTVSEIDTWYFAKPRFGPTKFKEQQEIDSNLFAAADYHKARPYLSWKRLP